MTDVEELGGHGVTAKVDGKPVAAGNARLMERLGLSAPAVSETGTVVHVAIDGRCRLPAHRRCGQTPTVPRPSGP